MPQDGISTSPAHVRILGPAELESDGEIVRPTGRPGALFALLVAGRGVLLPTERLVDELWSGSPPLTAASAFRVHLGRLRNMGAREYIADARAQYGIRAHLVTIDAILFERELARARQLGGDKALGEAVLSYESALRYWRGDAFQGFTDVPSLLVESNRLQELREGGRDELIELLLVLGRNDKVIEQASAPAGREWMRERRAGYLMTALYRSGRQQEALDVFGRLRRGLLEEMGLDPTPELQRLERAILWQSPDMEWRGPSPDDEGVVDLPIVPVTWVGREEVLDAVRSAWGRIVVVVGASGMGKTGILAKAAAEWAGADDVAVVFGAAEREGAEELGPFVQALGRALRLPEEGSDSALIIDAVREAMRRLAGAKRLVILLDDFQWADTQSAALLDALSRRSLGSNVAILVATRPASESAGLRQRRSVTEVQLTVFHVEEIATLLSRRGLAGDLRLTAERIDSLTGGVPFLVSASIDMVTAYGPDCLLNVAASGGALAGVVDVMLRGFDRGRRAALSVLALCGPTIEFDLWASLSSIDRPELTATLNAAIDAGLIVRDDAGARFRHDLVREALVASLAASEASSLHASAAELLADRVPWRAAFHALEGIAVLGEERAIEFVMIGAGVAKREGRFDHAARLWGHVQILLARTQPLAHEKRFSAAMEAAAAWEFLGLAERARPAFVEAFEIAERARRPDWIERILLMGTAVGRSMKTDPELLSMLKRAITLEAGFDASNRETALRCEYVTRLAFAGFRPDSAVDREIGNLEAKLGATTDSVLRPRLLRALLTARLGAADASWRRRGAAQLLAETDGEDFDLRSDAFAFAMRAHIEAADPHGADALLGPLEAFCSGTRRPVDLWGRAMVRGCLAELSGDLQLAGHYAREARALGREFGIADAELCWQAQVFSHAWQLDRIRSDDLRVGSTTAAVGAAGLAAMALGAAAASRRSEGRALLADAVPALSDAPVDSSWVAGVCVAVEAAWQLADEGAASLLSPLIREYEDVFVVVGLTPMTTYGPLARTFGQLEVLAGNEAHGVALFETAIDRCAKVGASIWRAHAQRDLATVLERGSGSSKSGNQQRARSLRGAANGTLLSARRVRSPRRFHRVQVAQGFGEIGDGQGSAIKPR